MIEETYRTRRKKQRLRITFPSGKIICYNNTTTTMIEALKEIGSEKFPLIHLELYHYPLISQEKHPRYNEYAKEVCDGWYLNILSDSDIKYRQMRAINDQLSLGLTIEIGTDFEVEKAEKKAKSSRAKAKVIIRFPDGEYVANDSALDSYIETIWKLGIEAIKRKHLTWGKMDLITETQIAANQIQVGDNRWVCVPSSIKDKAKLLRIISTMLKIPLDITIV